MNGSENKTPLALMEQVIMVFVFALAAALCVQVFVYARTMSVNMERRDQAMVVCQSIAETAKVYAGRVGEMCKSLDAGEGENELFLFYDEEWKTVKADDANACYKVWFRVLEKSEFCGEGEVVALTLADETEIFSLEIAWQE